MDLFKKLIYAPVVEDDTFDNHGFPAAVCDCRLFSMLPDVKYMYDYDRVGWNLIMEIMQIVWIPYLITAPTVKGP